jgi:flagellar FliJ protein
MAKFKFRLQSLIKVKEIQEKKVERELATIKNNILKEQARLDDLKHEHERLVSASPVEGKVRAADIALHQDYIQKISSQIHFENTRIVLLTQSENKKIDEVMEVKKDKEAIERLREKRFEEYKKDVEKKEQVLIDALAQRISG